MIEPAWYAHPDGEGLILRTPPRLASWEKSTHPDQVRLREYLEDTAELLSPSMISGPWALGLEVGLPPGRDPLEMADLDNYAFPLASRLRNEHLVSVWSTKRNGVTSRVLIAPARRCERPPGDVWTVRTTASSQTMAFKEQIHLAVADADELPPGPVLTEIAFVVGPRRNWLTLWKPTIDALDTLLGRTRPDRDWHPLDGRITNLGLHVSVDESLGHDVIAAIAARSI